MNASHPGKLEKYFNRGEIRTHDLDVASVTLYYIIVEESIVHCWIDIKRVMFTIFST